MTPTNRPSFITGTRRTRWTMHKSATRLIGIVDIDCDDVARHVLANRVVLHAPIVGDRQQRELGNHADEPAIVVGHRQTADLLREQQFDGMLRWTRRAEPSRCRKS